jgi:hypothetical protein
MGKLLDRIKRGLRSLGGAQQHVERSADDEPRPAPMPQRLRTELDGPGPSELAYRLLRQERALPPGPTRQRKANLSKARRVVPGENALTIWGLSGPACASLFDEHASSSERPPLFTGSTLGRASQVTTAPSPVASDWTLQGSSLLAPRADEQREPLPLFGPADGLGPPDDRSHRLF